MTQPYNTVSSTSARSVQILSSREAFSRSLQSEGVLPEAVPCVAYAPVDLVWTGRHYGWRSPRGMHTPMWEFNRSINLYLQVKPLITCGCVCVCVFSSHSFWTSMDVPAGVTQEEGNTGLSIHLLSAVRALIFLARRIQPFLPLVDRKSNFVY